MTDWGVEPDITPDDIRVLDIEGNPAQWFWVFHTNGSFNGDEGILHFTNGRAAYAPEYIYDRNKAAWFQDDGAGGVELNPEGRVPPLWILPWCWVTNGFRLTEMNGGPDEYDELVPDESP